ncbi:MAG: UDP-N-acetylmuramoyl-L-alanyl-D-glutamate--2,6-diaminopimelate ligase, partial [Gemmatimonadetes bacterium]|nr:UDP-N-acetylmuramoyl-L-alanyl-D-glutamate--2,6-diaminopimelate ligase [Gemmatimonadota bacterium]
MGRRRNVHLSQIVQRLDRLGLLAEPASLSQDPLCIGLTDDSRRVRPGVLFCAVRGTRDDGHRYVRAAAEAGAVAALVEAVDPSLAVPQVRVRDARRAVAHAAQVFYGDPGRRVILIGVTGTNGKTTTVHLTQHVLGARLPAGSVGTLGVCMPDGRLLDTGLTTPGPIEFAEALDSVAHAGAGAVAVEVSSHALDQARADGFAFDVAIFTNLSRDHLDYHRDSEEYRRAKLRLADLVKGDGVLVINADDPGWAALAAAPRRIVTYGVRARAEYGAEGIQQRATGSRWRLRTPEGDAETELPLLGEYNIANALAAGAAAGTLGLDAAEIAERLRTTPPVPGRLEPIAERPCLVLCDYAHTADALSRALAAVRILARGRVIVVFGAGGDRDPGKRPLMGAAAAEGADHIIVTSDNPRTEDPAAIIEQIVRGIPEGRSYE